ncbi:MAG: hypothetical protein ACRDRI_12455 [Pseudonocardiaceae bacterium]
MTRLAWMATATVVVRGVSGTVNTLSSLAWLRAAKTGHGIAESSEPPCIVLILPLLREQQIFADTVNYFTDLAKHHGQTAVVLVTAEREHHEPNPVRAVDPSWPSTIDMACALAVGAPAGVVRHLHYPDKDGVMVHQVNFAAHAELARLAEDGIDPQQVWLAVYNADSRPHPATLDVLAHVTRGSPQQGPRIVQQSALFTTNLRAFPPGARGAVLAGVALLQSRWTLAREVPRLRRQAGQARRSGVRWPRLAHCVGHGLFIRGDEFLVSGGLPTEPMNEDLAFGYFACVNGTSIEPLPLLEHGDSPAAPAGVVRQARQWFWSYTEYPLFVRLAESRGLGDRRTRAWLAAQGLARGALWLGQSPAIAFTLALPMITHRRLVATVASIGAVATYYVLPAALLAANERHEGRDVRFGTRELLGGIAAALLSSAGPWWCLANAVHRWCTGTTYTHDKTER